MRILCDLGFGRKAALFGEPGHDKRPIGNTVRIAQAMVMQLRRRKTRLETLSGDIIAAPQFARAVQCAPHPPSFHEAPLIAIIVKRALARPAGVVVR
jgi:hypothetical protein